MQIIDFNNKTNNDIIDSILKSIDKEIEDVIMGKTNGAASTSTFSYNDFEDILNILKIDNHKYTFHYYHNEPIDSNRLLIHHMPLFINQQKSILDINTMV